MLRSHFLAVVLTSTFLLTSAPLSQAAQTTEWMNSTQLKKFSNVMQRKGYFPTKIKCKRKPAVGGIADPVLVRMTYETNYKKASRWAWAYSGNLHKLTRQYKASGFKLVSRSSFSSLNGGFILKCGLWHK
ncbi:MAG: hypothetical protein JJ858_16135 [Rhizobiaceae bacterium]|nr:hypothetical protein [Rhizobiaceae bacterium]